jgi:hypothetical protein
VKREFVASSNIKSVGYDPRRQRLEVEFVGGKVYEYEGVPLEQYQALMDAGSVGGYFSSNIKNDYACNRVT